MAQLSLANLEGRLLAMVHGKLDAAAARMLLDNAYRTIMGTWDWSFNKVEDDFNSLVEKTDGTITLTNAANTIAGASTTFSSDYNGGYIIVDDTRYQVNTFTDTTTGTLTGTYAGTTGGSKSYTLVKSHYELAASVSRIVTLTGGSQQSLIEVPPQYLDNVDPSRQSTGVPLYYAYVGIGATNEGRVIELWPAPSTALHYNYTGVKFNSLTLTSSSGLIEEGIGSAVLRLAASEAALSVALLEKETAQVWMAASQKWMQEGQAELMELQMQDLQASGAARIQGRGHRGESVGSEYASKHDLLLNL
jgi:hypothetical protein